MEYKSILLKQDIVIDHLFTVHYFEYTNKFLFSGEKHNFWEFLYVDKGEIEVVAGTNRYVLKTGDIIFHKPMEFHNLWANGIVAPNLVVVSFECNSPAMDFFKNKIFQINDHERNLLARIVSEAKNIYSSQLDDPNLKKLERKEEIPFGGEQIIKISLECMLIQLIRRGENTYVNNKITSSIKEKTDKDIFNKVIIYLEDNISNKITLDDICRNNLIGRSYLQKIFREKVGGGVMEYFGKMKIETAKQIIRESSNNFTEIAHSLGYSSIHYFSRHFKKVTGMTPSEYACSVKIRSESSADRIDFLN